jgi:hypothetical protein
VLLFLFGGGGGLGLVLVICLIIYFMGEFRSKTWSLSGNSASLRSGGRCAVSAAREVGGDSAPPAKSWQVSDSLQ